MDISEYIRTRAEKIEPVIYGEIPAEPKEVYGMLSEFISRGGKRIRPVLTLACASACGGEEEDALPFAVAIELFHNFTLIHDDLEDRSPMRRGKPTLHTEYGEPIAINSGDALYTVVWSSLLSKSLPPELLVEAEKVMIGAFRRVVEGQGTELNWYREKKFDVSEENYFAMAGGKTAALIRGACELGALSAGAPQKEKAALANFGERIGLAFQIRDDVLNLTADPAEYRKQIGEDIREGKRTLITIHLLANAEGEKRERALSVLSKQGKSDEEVHELISLAKEAGSVDYASSAADRFISEAKAELENVGSDEGKELLNGISDYIVKRPK